MIYEPRLRTLYYTLDDAGEPQRCTDAIEWSAWLERANRLGLRLVARDRDEGGGGDGILVSTVFLGLDHNFFGSGPPVLWETLVFGGPLDGEMNRYTSRAAALAGHQVLCDRVRAACPTRVPDAPTGRKEK